MAGEIDLAEPEEAGDRIVIRLEPGGPIDLTGLSNSFAALARLYARHYRHDGDSEIPKLFITKLQTGSIIAEITPYVATYGMPMYSMLTAANNVAGFTKRLNDGIKAFAGLPVATPSPLLPSPEDAADLREFVKPLSGRRNAALGIKHARFRKTDGQKETVVEYSFDEAEINRAAINIDRALQPPEIGHLVELDSQVTSNIKNEVMLIFEKASRLPGKEDGRATDWTIVPDISAKALPTYFRKSVGGNLKDIMVRGETNPLTDTAFIVDVHVQMQDGKPKAYIVTDFHAIVPFSRDG